MVLIETITKNEIGNYEKTIEPARTGVGKETRELSPTDLVQILIAKGLIAEADVLK